MSACGPDEYRGQPDVALIRRQQIAGDLTVDGLLWHHGGRTSVDAELATLGGMFASSVGAALDPINQGPMFSVEICNVAKQGLAYVEGESAKLRKPSSGTAPFGWDDIKDWVVDTAKEIYHDVKTDIRDTYRWCKDELEEVGGKFEEAFERMLNSGCNAAEFAWAVGCTACALGGGAATVVTEGAAAPLLEKCGLTCITSMWAVYQACHKGDAPPQPNSLVTGPQMSELRQ